MKSLKRSAAKEKAEPLLDGRHRVWVGQIPVTSVYTAGVGGQIFLAALKERGQLVGTRCERCSQVYVPARRFCERCFAELTQEVPVGPGGTLKSFTCSMVDRDGRRLAEPHVLALVQLDGATTVLVHRLLGASAPAKIVLGSRVKAVIKPKAKRVGSILDIEGFTASRS